MPLDKGLIGLESDETFVFEVEKGAIRRFCEAIGEKNPVYLDEEAARAAGFAGITAPPTFPITAQFDFKGGVRTKMKIDMKRVLHGEQHFFYKRPLVVGDKLFLKQKVVDVSTKEGKSGGMDFLTIDTTARDADGKEVFTMRGVTVIRH